MRHDDLSPADFERAAGALADRIRRRLDEESMRLAATAASADTEPLTLEKLRAAMAGLERPALNGRLIVSHHLPLEEVGAGQRHYRRPLWRRLLSGRMNDIGTRLGHPRAFAMADGTLIVAPETEAAIRAGADTP